MTHCESEGTSYTFNAVGCPFPPQQYVGGGLDGLKISSLPDPARTIVFLDAAVSHGYSEKWHIGGKANVCFADGHVVFMDAPGALEGSAYRWAP